MGRKVFVTVDYVYLVNDLGIGDSDASYGQLNYESVWLLWLSSDGYLYLVYTKTVDSFEGALRLTMQTPRLALN